MTLALAMPPVDLSVSGLGSGSRAVIDGAGEAFSTHLDLDGPSSRVVETSNGSWIVLDVVLTVGRDDLVPRLPEVSRRGSRTVVRLSPRPDAYSVWVRPGLEADDTVRVGPVGAPVAALQSASAFGTQLDARVPQGGELHHRVAVRVDRVRGGGMLRFPLIYRLEAEQARPDLSTQRRWR